MSNENKVAETILEQLGGGKFIAMTGAKNLGANENGLQFKIMRNAKKVTHVKITLNSLDLYDVEFLNINRKYDIKKIASYKNIDAVSLRDIFTENTGLYTSL